MSIASLRQPLTLRRILFSLLVAGMVAVLVGGALGFAAASDGQANPAAPSDSSEPYFFGVPEPRLGDSYLQAHTFESNGPILHDGQTEKAESSTSTKLERGTWVATESVLNAQGESRAGITHLAEFGLEQEDQEMRGVAETVYDAGTRQSILSRYAGADEIPGESTPSYLPTFSGSSSSKFSYAGTTWHSDSFGQRSCFLFNELQGTTADLSQDVVLFRSCYLAGDRMPTEGGRLFRAIGDGTVGDRAAIVFAEVADGEVAPDARKVWMSADVPYPIHFEAEFDSEDGIWDGRATSTLTDFVAGSEPLPREGETGDDLPALELKPLTPWTIDDAGIAHPFPLSTAYTLARDDALYAGLRDFLAAHPDAQVVEADYDEQSSNSGDRHRTWNYILAAGDDELAVCSTQTTRSGHDAVPWDLPAERPSVTDVAHQDCYDSGRPKEPASRAPLPDRLPSVASLFERWRRVAGDAYAAEAANLYSFRTECAWTMVHEDHSCQPILGVSVGYKHGRMEQGSAGVYVPVAGDDYVFDWRISSLSLDPKGNLFYLHESGITMKYDVTSGGPTAEIPAREKGVPIVVQSQTTSASLWELPAGTYAAGTGAAALFAGLLYWLWPALKGVVALPFYSRVEKPRALEHGVRAEIHALVQASPGIHTEELVRRTGRGRGDVQHHLHKLMGVGLLAEVRAAGFTCYHVPGQVDQRVAAALPALKSDGARAVLAAIAAQPGSSGTRLATTTGLTRQAVHLHVHRLAEAGLVTTERAGREVRIQATALAAQVPADA